MSFNEKILVTVGFLVLLLIIGTMDGLITHPTNHLLTVADTGDANPPIDTTSPAQTATTGTGTMGVQRQDGPNVFDVLNAQTIVTETTQEESLIQKIVPSDVALESRVLLKNNDRIAFFSWIETSKVKDYFLALKEALHASFSSDLRDLVDENQQRDGKPVRDVLSFLDPAIHEDRLLFVRVRQRLYEFHVAPGKEQDVQSLMDALTE